MPVIASRTGYTTHTWHPIVMSCVWLHIPAVALRGLLFRDLLTKKAKSKKS